MLSDLRDLTTAVCVAASCSTSTPTPSPVWEALRGDALVGPAGRQRSRAPGARCGRRLRARRAGGDRPAGVGVGRPDRRGPVVQAAGDPLPAPASSHPPLPHARRPGRAGRRVPRCLRHAVGSATCARGAGRRGGARPCRIDAVADPLELRRELVRLPGIGPWTAEYVAMRVLATPMRSADRPGHPPGGAGGRPARRPRAPRRRRRRGAAMAQLRHGPPVVFATPTAEIPTPPMKGRAA